MNGSAFIKVTRTAPEKGFVAERTKLTQNKIDDGLLIASSKTAAFFVVGSICAGMLKRERLNA